MKRHLARAGLATGMLALAEILFGLAVAEAKPKNHCEQVASVLSRLKSPHHADRAKAYSELFGLNDLAMEEELNEPNSSSASTELFSEACPERTDEIKLALIHLLEKENSVATTARGITEKRAGFLARSSRARAITSS